ncbi:hypothetical protein [Streptomyces sp. NPDC059759]|uniref:hypothetical protein n=1 Tax=unclassified Streptomyces TaxID=2593676 RepID=UPI003662313A
MGGLLDGDFDARADRRGGSRDEVVAVTTQERLPVGGRVLVDRDGEGEPEGREDEAVAA